MKLNLVVRIVFYCALSVLISPYYDGWSSTSRYLIREGVYESECTSAELALAIKKDKVKCKAQAYRVGRLLSFYRISEFLSSVFIGMCMDNVGPRITIIISIFLRMLSWFLIPIYHANTPVIMLCCILCGITTNGLAFPVYTLSQYTTKYYNLCMIAVSIALSLGTFYTVVLNYIYDWFPDASSHAIIYTKLAITHLPFMLLSFLVFPDDLTRDIEKNGVKLAPEPKDVETPKGSKEEVEISSLSQYREAREEVASTSADEKPEWSLADFLKIVSRTDVMTLSLAAMVSIVSLTFAGESFPITYAHMETAMRINEVCVPLSFLFSIISIWFLDNFGSVPVIVFLNVMCSIMHIVMIFNTFAASVISSIIMSLGYSLFLTQYYIYLDKEVPLSYSGSIKGCLVTSIGVILFSNIGLNMLAHKFGSAKGIHIGCCIARLVLTGPMVLLLKRRRIVHD
ncbi:hypothetical protein BEWA_024820 [Theileria equi strain WA]|uniref:Uncharacterized protein n=1 Tax=Theileria equi strain WA TaxID=1537102 RepID=L0AWJ9_THEEQ|nr:hypothetical protein BEWA_024820 [Theileria equi strain WA]AFZ79633.1 hypothetical protein BEWA_024820 [Theileria equi strain WA]|eukprot:XP_004829299.1 hypothetical protein BEWA_024820 [Theileria equi strain WA]